MSQALRSVQQVSFARAQPAVALFGLLLSMNCFAGMAQTAPPAPSRAPSAEPAGEVIAGRVTSAADGRPLSNATVTLNPQSAPGGRRQGSAARQSQTARTDAEGRYRFPSQPAGRYTLRASAAGYLGSLYLEHEGYSSAIVTGAGVPTDDLRFALVAEASLHGRVLDEGGEPVHANLTLYRDMSDERGAANAASSATERFRVAAGVQADDDGGYEFPNLQPGTYYVAASASPWYAVFARPSGDEEHLPYRTSIDPALDVAYPVTFYPHATTESGARPIALKAGQRATANLLMQAERAVTLTVQVPPLDAAGQNGAQPFPVLFHKVFGSDQPSGSQMTGRTGDTITVSGVAPGQYVMRAFGRGGPSAEETPVDLSTGSGNVTMHALSVTAGDVRLAMHTPNEGAVPESVQVNLQRVGQRREPVQQMPGKMEQGVVPFANVPSGDYRIRVFSDGNAWNVSRLTVGGKVVPSKLLHVDGGTVQAEIVCSSYAPELDGVVHTRDGKPHAGSLVLLVPAGADSSDDLYRSDQSDLDGSFQFSNVLPGNYLLVAIDDDWKLNWTSPAALMPYLTHALPVTVSTSGPRIVLLKEGVVGQQK